jgi:hypothetical protein
VIKKLILVVLVAGLAWWYFIGGRRITEEHARQYYQNIDHATGKRDPELLCGLLDSNFHSEMVVSTLAGRVADSQDKKQACEAYVELYKSFEMIGQRMGGIVQLDTHYEIHSVEISADSKTAVVDMSYALDVGGAIMNIRSRSTDTLVRRNGRVLMLRTEGRGTIGSGGGSR